MGLAQAVETGHRRALPDASNRAVQALVRLLKHPTLLIPRRRGHQQIGIGQTEKYSLKESNLASI